MDETSNEIGRLDKGYNTMLNGAILFTDLHTHTYYECNVIMDGTLKNISNGIETILNKGDFHVFAPSEVHKTPNFKKKVPTILTIMVAQAEFDKWVGIYGDILRDCFTSKYTHRLSLPTDEFAVLFKNYERIYFLSEDKKIPFVKTMFSLIVSTIIRDASGNLKNAENSSLVMALEQMNTVENMVEGMDALIRMSSFSRGHLHRLMKEKYNTTPLAYITALRMNYAANLLLYSNKDILQIAMEVGYFSISHFITQFKKSFGLSPKKYRTIKRKGLMLL